jgi:hypothetical protein
VDGSRTDSSRGVRDGGTAARALRIRERTEKARNTILRSERRMVPELGLKITSWG